MKLRPRCHAVLGLAAAPPWTVNAGLIVGDARTLIVDTGSSAAAARTLLGYAEALRPANGLVAVVTEGHLDHLLGVSTLRDRGIDVLGHASIRRRPEELVAEIASLAACVPDPVRRDRGEAGLLFAGARVENPSVPLAAETILELGGVDVRLLFTPGHTPGNLSAWVAEARVLYTGDCVVEGWLPNLEGGDPEAWRTWLASLDRLAALEAEVLVPGHGAVLEGAAVPAAIDDVRRVLDEALRTGRPPTGST